MKVQDKTDNLFEDNTDIFSDVPAAKPRPAKVKKENNNKPSIFSDSDGRNSMTVYITSIRHGNVLFYW